MIGGFPREFRLSTMKPKNDLKALTELVGGFDIKDLDKAEEVLEIIESRAKKTRTTIQDNLAFVAFYTDSDKFPCPEKAEEWEITLKTKIAEGASLLEKRQIADFYGLRNIREQQVFWLKQIVQQLDQEPTTKNFFDIANWCEQPTGAFLQNTNETTELLSRTGYFMLGLNIQTVLRFHSLEEVNRIYPNFKDEYEKKIEMIDMKKPGWARIIFPLEAVSTDDGTVMKMLQEIQESILNHFPSEMIKGLIRV